MFNILVCTLGVLIFILWTIVTISLGVGKNVIIIPTSTPHHEKEPVYIEWDGSNLIIHPKKETINLSGLNEILNENKTVKDIFAYIDGTIEKTPLFKAKFDEINSMKGKMYFFILVRPSGFETFHLIRIYFKDKKLDIGYEPINQDWKLKLG